MMHSFDMSNFLSYSKAYLVDEIEDKKLTNDDHARK